MTRNKKNDCLEDLQQRILSMDIAPGSDLDEAALAEHYGISRTPLRETIQRLAGDGYVALTKNRGAKATSLDLPTLRIFFQTAPMIYANIAKLAAENRTTDQLAPLKKTQAKFATACADRRGAEAAWLNHSFHEQIGWMAHNPYLLAGLKRMLIDHTRLSQTFYRPQSPEETALVNTASDHHDALIVAIEARDADAAVELSLRHWDLSKDRLENYVQPDPLPIHFDTPKDTRNAV